MHMLSQFNCNCTLTYAYRLVRVEQNVVEQEERLLLMRLEVHTVCEQLRARPHRTRVKFQKRIIHFATRITIKSALRVRTHLFEISLLHKDATGHNQLHELCVFVTKLPSNVQHTAPTLALVHRLVDAVGAVAHRRKSHFQRLSVIFEHARDCARKQNKLSATPSLCEKKMKNWNESGKRKRRGNGPGAPAAARPRQ
jgi:hypothetical protein